MFCTDDKHPNDLLEKGHIDYIVKKAISLGADPITAIKAACHNAARYFLLNNRGAIAPGYLADFVVIDDFDHFNIEQVYKRGALMVDHGVVAEFPTPEIDPYLVSRAHDTFHVASLTAADFTDSRPHAVIGMVDGEITTTDGGYTDRIDVDYDILKIAVIERHKNTHHIGLGYIKGYGLKSGAVATSIATTATTSSWWAPTRRTWPSPPTASCSSTAASPWWTAVRSRASCCCPSPASCPTIPWST